MSSISESILESFKLDPVEYSMITVENYFEDGSQYMNDLLEEATKAPITKKQILSKIVAFIKKVVAWLVKQWQRFVQWIRKLLGKKNTKSADQCIMDAIGNNSSKKIPEDPNSKTISIPFHPQLEDGVESVDKITLAYKDLQCKIEGDKITFILSELQSKSYSSKIPGTGTTMNSPYFAEMIFDMIKNPENLKKLTDIIAALEENKKDPEWSNNPDNVKSFVDKFNDINDYYMKLNVSKETTVTINQITDFNSNLIRLHKALDFF